MTDFNQQKINQLEQRIQELEDKLSAYSQESLGDIARRAIEEYFSESPDASENLHEWAKGKNASAEKEEVVASRPTEESKVNKPLDREQFNKAMRERARKYQEECDAADIKWWRERNKKATSNSLTEKSDQALCHWMQSQHENAPVHSTDARFGRLRDLLEDDGGAAYYDELNEVIHSRPDKNYHKRLNKVVSNSKNAIGMRQFLEQEWFDQQQKQVNDALCGVVHTTPHYDDDMSDDECRYEEYLTHLPAYKKLMRYN